MEITMKYCLKIKYLFLFIFLVTLSGRLSAQPTPPSGMKWEVVPALTDEFDSWNSSKWGKSLWNYGEPVQMLDKNSGVTDGKLWIKATLNDGQTRWFETSRIMSKTQISYPMYTECSMRTADISAYNTFWLNNGNSENRDEIDIVENNAKPSCGCQPDFPWQMNSQYFLVVNNDVERAKGNFDNRNLSNDNPLKGVKWNEQFHRVGVWWKDKNNIQFYLDGEPAGEVTTSRDFTRQLNIIWDLWTIDATWSGGIANKADLLNDQINTMYVDWIHTYSMVADGLTGVSNVKTTNDIQVYPNPADDYLVVASTKDLGSNANLYVYNDFGQLVKKEQLQAESQRISIEGLASGVYILTIRTNKKVLTQSFVKN